ncbi:MAG TPA: histidine kinase [Thermoleophilaceae bacterium]|jgi:signal transduction histidine kinase|nr:histidine kinase [Thermoleophilaceae bacterium]
MDASAQRVSLPRWQRLVLPGGLLGAPPGRRSARDWVVDSLMFLLAAAIGTLTLVETWSDHTDVLAVIDIVVGVTACLALWYRRSHPVLIAVFALVASIFSALAAGPAVMALFNAMIRTSGRTASALVGLALLTAPIFPLVYPGQDSYGLQLLVGLLITGVVVGWGLFVRAQRELVRSLRERAERLEGEQRLRIEQAREAERLRIAREMHDVLAHRVSLLALHAGALEFHPDAPPEEIAEAAGVIRATAHSALEDLREVIGVLRAAGDDAGPERPQPTLADIPALVEECRAAGMEIRLRFEAATDEAPVALGRTAYRVVQEGLTNARKHAPAAAVEVVVRTGAGRELVVEVVSRSAVGVRAGAEPLPGAGTGLAGLAERVALAGGDLEHGPGAGGDFVLRATLPGQ